MGQLFHRGCETETETPGEYEKHELICSDECLAAAMDRPPTERVREHARCCGRVENERTRHSATHHQPARRNPKGGVKEPAAAERKRSQIKPVGCLVLPAGSDPGPVVKRTRRAAGFARCSSTSSTPFWLGSRRDEEQHVNVSALLSSERSLLTGHGVIELDGHYPGRE